MSQFLSALSPDHRERLASRLHEVNGHIRERGVGQGKAKGALWSGMNADLLTGYSYGEYYDWDLYFENLYLSHFGVSLYCRTNLEVFLDRQLACGFVARTLIEPRQRQHFKPFLAQIAVLGSRQFGSFAWLAGKYYERLAKYLDYWRWFCDFDKNGLSVWDSADHSGMDNQVLRAGPLDTMSVEGVDLNCYLVRELDAMEWIARALDLPADSRKWAAEAAALRGAINDILYDEADGFYYDRDERTGALIRVKSASSFAPLWAGVADARRAGRLVGHLTDPDEFWLAHPLASWARNEVGYYQQRRGFECTWMGACWVPINYMAAHGLMRYGYTDVAHALARKTFDMALNEITTREYYDAETGVGQGLNPFWGWSALAYTLPLELEACYDPTDLGTAIRPLAGEATDVRF